MGLVETIIIYFFVGLIQDFLITLHAITIIEKRPLLAGILAIINTLIAATIWHYIVPAEALSFWIAGIPYSVGGGLAVGGTIWYKKKKSNIQQ